MAQKDLWLVFGGGKFGTRVLKTFQSNTQILIIDQDPHCEATFQLSTSALISSYPNVEDMISIIKSTQNSLFIVGDLSLVVSLWKALHPIYLIPMVPLHLMKEFVQSMILEKYTDIMISEGIIPAFRDCPSEINFLSPDESTIYLSYAKFHETCPDNCQGNPGYCNFHRINKPITITQFVEENFSPYYLCNFESIQLAAGIGGICNEQIHNVFANLKTQLDRFSAHDSWTCLISTTCNCHGVISAIQLDKKKEDGNKKNKEGK